MKRQIESPEKIITSINNKVQNVAAVSRISGVSYSHLSNVSRRLEEDGILERVRKDGKSTILILTEKGERIKEAYIKLAEAYAS